jgi:O-methyltransferase
MNWEPSLLRALKSRAARGLNRALQYAAVEINQIGTRRAAEGSRFTDLEPWVARIIAKAAPFTMTSDERISALCHAVRYVTKHGIPGDIAECGVWRGGSMMAAALTLLGERDLARTLYLFDTFEGMPPPTDIDRAAESGKSAALLLEAADESSLIVARAPLDDVRANLASTNYPADRIRFIKGRVEDTIPREAPERIAILRLDTDWYASTRHELIHLYPRLSVGGVLVIDDYGHWEGARKAVDEYINDNRLRLLLQRIDYTGRIAVKTAPV